MCFCVCMHMHTLMPFTVWKKITSKQLKAKMYCALASAAMVIQPSHFQGHWSFKHCALQTGRPASPDRKRPHSKALPPLPMNGGRSIVQLLHLKQSPRVLSPWSKMLKAPLKPAAWIPLSKQERRAISMWMESHRDCYRMERQGEEASKQEHGWLCPHLSASRSWWLLQK